MNQTQVLDKVRKLLRLSESPNPNEAALAAAKAQQLIDEHNLSAALLELETGVAEPDEPIVDFMKMGSPLEPAVVGKNGSRWMDRWKGGLAVVIAGANGCRVYKSAGAIALVGRPSDADTVRYLYSYVVREIERLCERDGRGCGYTWKNNYKLGAVDTIKRRLSEQKASFAAQVRRDANSTALVRVNQALAKVEQRVADVDTFLTKSWGRKFKGSGGTYRATYDATARQMGREAAASIALGGQKGNLGSGQRRLGS